MTGYQGADQSINKAHEVCAQMFTYNLTSILSAQNMAPTGPLASCFLGLQFLTFTYSLPGATAALDLDSLLEVDDLQLTVTSCK